MLDLLDPPTVGELKKTDTVKDKHSDVVFIYGALRSGTTLFRLMLDAHPQISNPGEMDFLFDHLTPDTTHKTGWCYDMDRLRHDRIFRSNNLQVPNDLTGLDLLDSFLSQLKDRAPSQVLSINLHRHIERLHQVLPQARILHMLRDPRDVARSSIQMGWAGTCFHGVGHWLKTEAGWDRCNARLSPERTLEMRYEDLLTHTNKTLNAVCDFFEVPFDPDMLRYHESTSYGPVDASLTNQWKRKCTQRELEEVENRAGSLMTQRGYTCSQSATSLSKARKVGLSLRNKTHVWKFGMARFGALTYWAEKITRWARLKTANQKLTLRMQQTMIQLLK
ncbi:MAG: sulfotransferase [Aliishimia sp.]